VGTHITFTPLRVLLLMKNSCPGRTATEICGRRHDKTRNLVCRAELVDVSDGAPWRCWQGRGESCLSGIIPDSPDTSSILPQLRSKIIFIVFSLSL